MGKDGSGQAKRSRRGTPPILVVGRPARATPQIIATLEMLDHTARAAVREGMLRWITEAKWREAKVWAKLKVTGKKYRYSRLLEPCKKPDSGPANAYKRLAAKFYLVEDGSLPYWRIPHVGEEAAHR